MINSKIRNSIAIIEKSLTMHDNCIIMTSFGKDSMVMTHLIRQVDSSIPYMFGREPFCPKKYEFADYVTNLWGLTVYNLYFPITTYIQVEQLENNYEIEVCGKYSCKEGFWVLPTGITNPTSTDNPNSFLCGLKDLYMKPKGMNNFNYDLVFLGQKSSDTDIFVKDCRVKSPIFYNKDYGLNISFPLEDWTNEDIWEYTRLFNVPQNEKRYPYKKGVRISMEEELLFREQYKDMTYNPDYFHCCTRCINRLMPEEVTCLKTGKVVSNISDSIRYVDKAITPVYLKGQ